MKPLHWDEINPATGTPYTYDHPNVRWGFVLEEFDAGFVPWNSPQPKPKPKPKIKPMKRQTYYPAAAGQQIIWLGNFVSKLAGHAAAVGVDAATCAARIADARWILYFLGLWYPAAKAWMKSCTETVALGLSPDGSNLLVLPVFTPPPLPAATPGGLPAVVPVEEGALDRLFATVQVIKEAEGYDASIGQDLGIIGAAVTPPDLNLVVPDLAAMVTATHVFLKWGWGGWREWLDLCEIQVDRGNGWETLIFDTDPNFKDLTPFPAALTKWKYRAIFRAGESRVGGRSAEVSVNVG